MLIPDSVLFLFQINVNLKFTFVYYVTKSTDEIRNRLNNPFYENSKLEYVSVSKELHVCCGDPKNQILKRNNGRIILFHRRFVLDWRCARHSFLSRKVIKQFMKVSIALQIVSLMK